MALSHEFDYVRAKSINEALQLKNKYRGKAMILAGGSDLIVNIKEGMLHPELLIDIKDLAEMNQMEMNEEGMHVGSLICFDDMINSDAMLFDFQMLHDACKTIASHGVRTRATLAGNICSAVPSLDSATPLLCHEASVHCLSVDGERVVPIDQWFLAPRKTALQDNEIVTCITIPKASQYTGIYLKLGRYGGEDLAQAGWGIMLSHAHKYRIAHCALGPVPKRAKLIEELLNGHELNDELIDKAIELIPREISPITDIRSSKEYRTHVSGVMLKRGLLAARDRLKGNNVDAAKLLGGIA